MNHNIGVRFRLQEKYYMSLKNIFEHLANPEYIWHIDSSEILRYSDPNTDLFIKENYTNNEFLYTISSEPYYVIQCRIFAAKNRNYVDFRKIKDYATFINSKCDFALLCADGYVDFYSSSEDIINTISNICINNSLDSFCFITLGNDTRTGFLV